MNEERAGDHTHPMIKDALFNKEQSVDFKDSGERSSAQTEDFSPQNSELITQEKLAHRPNRTTFKL